jgi:hypothetical protein
VTNGDELMVTCNIKIYRFLTTLVLVAGTVCRGIASETDPGIAYKPWMEFGDGERTHRGIRIMPVAVSCNRGYTRYKLDEVMAPLVVANRGFGDPPRTEDQNPISLLGMKIQITPAVADDQFMFDDRATGTLRVEIDLAATSETKYMHDLFTCSDGDGCLGDLVASVFYSVLLTVDPKRDRTMEFRVKCDPEDQKQCAGFNGDFRWDNKRNQLVGNSLNGYVLTPQHEGGWLTYRKGK